MMMMMMNALKYTSYNRPPKITVDHQQSDKNRDTENAEN